MDHNKQENKKNERAKTNTNDEVPDLYRICPSQLTKHELEDLYFTVLDTNIQLRKTIQGQEGKIKQLSNKLQRKVAAQKVLEAEEFKDCCVITKTKLRQQKESLAQLRRAHDKTAERIRRINVRLSSEKTPQPSLLKCIRCEPETSSYSCSLKNSASYLSRQRQGQANAKSATASVNVRNRVIIMNSVATQTDMPRYNGNTKSYETQTDSTVGSTEIESSEPQNESLTDKDTDNSGISLKESFKKNYKNVTTLTEPLHYQNNIKNIENNNGCTRTTQTENESSVKSNVITKSIQTQTDPIIDDLSSERQIESASYKNYKLNNTDNYQQIALCDKNKCRTHINELKQKISKLVTELDNTHHIYSTRIDRLEVELQEYRNTNVHHVHQYDNCINQLVNNLKEAHVLSTELKEQLAVEKRKVAELVDLMRTIKMSNRVTRSHPQPLVNIDSQNYNNGIKQDSAACTCCREINMPTNSDKREREIANKKQDLLDGKRVEEVPNTITQQNSSKNETVEDLPENGIIQDTKTDRNILNFTLPKPMTDGSKILRNIYWNSKTHHASDALPSRNDGIGCQNSGVCNSDQQLQNKESFLDKKGSPEDKNTITSEVDNVVNAFDAIASESMRNSNMNVDKHSAHGIQEISEDIAVTSGSQGLTETAKNLNRAVTEFNPDLKYNGSKNRRSYDFSNENRGQTGEKTKKDFDPNILAASLANVAEKQKAQTIEASNLTEVTDSNLVRQEGELSIPQLGCSSLPHITEVIFKESKIEIPVNDPTKPFQNDLWSDQQATTLNPKCEAQSKTADNIETKSTRSVKREKRYSEQLSSPKPTFISETEKSSRKTDVLNLIDEINKTRITREEKKKTEHTKSNETADELKTSSEEKRRKKNTKCEDIADETRISSKEKQRKEIAKTKDICDEIRINSVDKRQEEITDKAIINRKEIRVNNTTTKDVIDETRTKSEEKGQREKTKTRDVNNATCINKEETAQEGVSKIVQSTSSPKNYKYTSKNDQNISNKSKYEQRTSSASQTDQGTAWVMDSMNNYYASGEGLNTLKYIRQESPVEFVPEKLDIQKYTASSDVPTKTQREISMYRRNSGTLCFTTTPGAERLRCECGKNTLCGGLINKGTQLKKEMKDISKYEQGTCTTGCEICSRATSPENRGDQVLTSVVKNDIAHYIYTPEDTSCPSESRRPNMLTNINDNYLRKAEEVSTSKAKSTLNNNDVKPTEKVRDSINERHTARVDGPQRVEDTLCDITEDLASCKHLLQMKHISSSAIAECQKVLNEFDTGRQYALKRGVAKHTINEEYSSKCMFMLHIGTVVLSDEAVLNYQDKSLALAWKFYDQNVTMTQMTAGRVVLFDFSTEYEVKMTDEFLNYMKHGELRILICEIERPDQPIASCTLPLRDALLNTNRRADMSLALIAGPEIYDRTANRRISDRLDSRDEMGVLDLWCMLHADANLAPVINRAIAQQSKFLTDQAADTLVSKNVLQQVTDDKSSATESQDIDISFSSIHNKPKHSMMVGNKPDSTEPINRVGRIMNGKRLSLHRWGSSVLRLPSREASEEISEDDANATIESVSIRGKYDPMYTNESKHGGMDVLQMSDRMVFDDNTHKYKHNGTQAQDMESKTHKQDGTPRESLEYDPSKYPATGRNSGTISTNDNYTQYIQCTDKSVGPTNKNMDSSYPIISEVTANIKSSDDMKRVMNRSSLPARSRVSKAETSVRQDAFMESQTFGASRTATKEMAKLKKVRQRQSLKEAADKRRKDETDFITMRPDSVILPKEPSDTSNINKKYDNIAKTFIRTEDMSKKQVTIKANHGSISEETPQKDQDSIEEEQTVDITILWLALNEECEAMLNPRVQRVYVAYEFLGRSGADMETPVSLPKPKHYVEKCYFNFKKTFVLDKEDIPLLSHMIRCRAASNIPRSNRDCIVFTVISEPPEDPLGLEICEDIGYANLFLGDLLAYSAGSPGYTEVIPVRSRYGTSVCGVLAVRLDGLDVLRQYLSIVPSQSFYPQID